MTDPVRGQGRRFPRAALFLALVPLCAPPALGQEEAQETPAPAATPAPAPLPVLAIKVGTLHSMAGPAVENAVILVRGDRIEAVGSQAELPIPEGAEVLDYSNSHAYPGLVDALSQACAPRGGDGIGDAGGEIGLALDYDDERSRELARYGVTTAYVSSRSASVWRGQGALVRFGPDGPEPFPGAPGVGVHLRLAIGNAPSHPLARIDQLTALGREFEQLEAYEKTFTDHADKLKEYAKKLEEYLEWHRKKTGKPAETPPAAGAAGAPARTEGRTGGRGRSPRGEGGRPPGERPTPDQPGGERPPGRGTPPSGETGGAPATPGQDPAKPAEGAAAKPEDKPPERPKFPPEPRRDPAKDALIRVRDGEMSLFVEVDRPEEVERALEIAREYGVKRLVLEGALRAGDAVAAIAEAGIPVLLAGAEPPPPEPGADEDEDEPTPIAVALATLEVPFAIGSLSLARARNLASIAAEAVGQGVPADSALRAVTIHAAQVLGIAQHCGSLEPGKFADLVLTSGPLLSSDTRILRVLSGGRTAHEAK